jgi:hypothetical protein
VGDVVQMRKPHPCGGDTWRVVRVGAEIGMRCLTCERKVFLRRSDFARRLKAFVQRGQPFADEPPGSSKLPGG